MIVIAYPCVGANTLANKVRGVINLETDAFWDYGKRPTNWQVYYCNIAKQLSKDGNLVFVSGHTEVLKRIEETAFDISMIVYPSLRLERRWVEKAQDRYNLTHSNRHLGELDRIRTHYISDVSKLIRSPLPKLELDTMEYDLKWKLFEFLEKNCELRGAKRVLKTRMSVEDYILDY